MAADTGPPQSLEAAVAPQKQGEEHQQHDDNESLHCGTPFECLRRAGRSVIRGNRAAWIYQDCFWPTTTTLSLQLPNII